MHVFNVETGDRASFINDEENRYQAGDWNAMRFNIIIV